MKQQKRTTGPIEAVFYDRTQTILLRSIPGEDYIAVIELTDLPGDDELLFAKTLGDANAEHIVACWNALEGWNPAYVREFLEASRKMIRDHMTPAEWVDLSKLLAKADGRIG